MFTPQLTTVKTNIDMELYHAALSLAQNDDLNLNWLLENSHITDDGDRKLKHHEQKKYKWINHFQFRYQINEISE